jgi:hypothetical protein
MANIKLQLYLNWGILDLGVNLDTEAKQWKIGSPRFKIWLFQEEG